jgi:hypothetical protein
MPSLPASIRADVVKLLYADADALDWERLPGTRKSDQYRLWSQDPRIGGRISQYLPDPHGWIKEVPMKEYSRALEGLGRFASFTPLRYAAPDDFVPRALGRGWRLIENTKGDKPPHCTATDGTDERYVCWGKPAQLKDLLWAALTDGLGQGTAPLVIVSLRSEADIEPVERRRHRMIAERCDVELIHVVRPLTTASH